MAEKIYVKLTTDSNGTDDTKVVYDSFADETTYPPFDTDDDISQWVKDNGYTFGKDIWAIKIEVREVS